MNSILSSTSSEIVGKLFLESEVILFAKWDRYPLYSSVFVKAQHISKCNNECITAIIHTLLKMSVIGLLLF